MFRNILFTLLMAWQLLIQARAANTASPSPVVQEPSTSYLSMRALDKFGNSVQLKHAKEAPLRYGRSIVAVSVPVTPSLDSSNPSLSSRKIIVVSLGDQGSVNQINLPLSSEPQSKIVAVSSTGLKGDISWLTKELQKHASHVWERFDENPMQATSVAHFLSRLFGSFQDQNVKEEWYSSIGRQDNKPARPLGVQTIILSTESPHLLVVEPTGRVMKSKQVDRDVSFVVAGKDSDKIKEIIQSSKIHDDAKDVEQSTVDSILKALSPVRNEIITLTVEVIEPYKDISRKRLVYKNGKQVTE